MTRKTAAELQEGDRFTLGDRVVEVQAGATHCIYLLPFNPNQGNEYVMRSTLDYLFPNGIPVTEPERCLTPCTYCCGLGLFIERENLAWFVKCSSCGARGPLQPSRREGRDAWNKAVRP